MKIKLDFNPDKISVGQFVGFTIHDGDSINQIQSITKLSRKEVMMLTPSQMMDIKNAFNDSLNNVESKFIAKWKDYAFVPDINAITFGEWLDLDAHCKDFPKQLTKILSILYRPVRNQLINRYEIDDYDSNIHLKNADDFNDMPLMIANGAMVFFSNIENELLNHFQEFSNQQMKSEMMKAITIMKEALQQQAN